MKRINRFLHYCPVKDYTNPANLNKRRLAFKVKNVMKRVIK